VGIPTRLEIPEGVSAGGKDVALDIHPKGKDEIDDERRTHGEKGDVNEPGTDTGSGYTHPLTYCRTHSKNLPLDEVFQLFHPYMIIFQRTDGTSLFITPCVKTCYARFHSIKISKRIVYIITPETHFLVILRAYYARR
jgi:hypothetical protein